MPDRGLLEARNAASGELAPGRTLLFEHARWLQITFEAEQQAVLEAMPTEAGRPIPPYARLLVVDAGTRRLAMLSVGTRFRMMPRNAVADVITQGCEEDALAALGTATPGSIVLERNGQEIHATVSGPDGELAVVTLPAMYAIEPSMLRWDGILVSGRHDGVAVLAELAPAPRLTAAFLSKGATVEPGAGLPRSHPWRRLRSLGTISACYAEGTLVLGEPVIAEAWG